MSCLSPETLKAYLANDLPEAERAATESHLSQCSACRHFLVQHHQEARHKAAAAADPPIAVPDELLETARAIGRRQGRARENRWVGSLAAAHLVVVAVGVGGWQLDVWSSHKLNPQRQSPPLTGAPGYGDTLRSDDPGDALTGAALVTAVGPEDGTVIHTDGVTLSWSVSGQVRETTLTLVDGLGNRVLQSAVVGMSWTLDPGRIEAMPPGTFYWFVTVRLDDGTTAETELRALRRP